MWDYLNFPEEYRVNKKLGREVFLKNANLTGFERRYLQEFMLTANVLYDIVFNDDSEIVILQSELKYIPDKEYFLKNYANAIAKSLPYKCLLILQCSGVMQIIVFNEHKNTKDARRMVVDGCICSKEIVFCEDEYFDRKLINDLGECITSSVSADDLIYEWSKIIDNNRNSNWLDEDSFNCAISRRNSKQDRRLLYECSLEKGDHITTENINNGCKLFDGVTIDVQNDLLDSCFLEFCADLSRPLYEEVVEHHSSEYFDEVRWLDDYIIACNEYASEILNKVFDSKSICYVKDRFYSDISMNNSQYYDEFDKEYLKQYLWKYFEGNGEDYD